MPELQSREGRLHAYGLGLILFSPSALANIPAGSDFMTDLDSKPRGRLYKPLVQTQRVVLLGTGSPQIDYAIRVVDPAAAEISSALKATKFGLRIEGGMLAIRDGYAPMEWLVNDPGEIRFSVPDGYYHVRALWMPRRDSDAQMHIDLVFEPTSARVPGNGWPILMYDGGLEPPQAERSVYIVTLKLHASPDAISEALRRAFDELRGPFRVKVLYTDVEAEPGELDASATRTNVFVDDCVIGIVVFTPLAPGDPQRVELDSVGDHPPSHTILAKVADAVERALAAMGAVVERFANF